MARLSDIAKRPTAIDLFAGAGGTTLGLRMAGFDVRVACDKDRIKAHWLAKNHRTVHVFGDGRRTGNVRLLDGGDLLTAGGLTNRAVDLLVSCPPCQGYSLQGARKVADPRNELYLEFVRITRQLKPSAVSFENVPGMLTLGDGRYLSDLVYRLEDLDYETAVWNLKASDYGVPQARERLFVVGCKGTKVSAPRRRSRPPTVAEAIEDLPTAPLEKGRDKSKRIPYLREATSKYAARLRGRRHTVTGCEVTNHSPEIIARFHEMKPGDIDERTRHRRLDGTSQATTLTAGTKSLTACRPVHPTEDRVITVREAARLASYPDWYEFPWQIAEAWSQIGNSVPPSMAAAIFRSVRASLPAG
jgi:DNA (cytosine-5)-methyltransferase 1